MAKRPSKRSIDPLDLSDHARYLDLSGSPAGLIELVRRLDDLALLDELDGDEVRIEFPMAERWRSQVGYKRFVRLRKPKDGKRYALVEPL